MAIHRLIEMGYFKIEELFRNMPEPFVKQSVINVSFCVITQGWAVGK